VIEFALLFAPLLFKEVTARAQGEVLAGVSFLLAIVASLDV